MTLDLNARRAALAESGEAAMPVVLGNAPDGTPLTWTFSTEMPINAVELLNLGDMMGVLRLLLPPDQVDAFSAQRPSMQEVSEIVTAISGVAVGNLQASTASSANTGKPSRPTSNASTTLTSAR